VLDVVRHEHDGLLVPTGGDEVSGFAEAIRRLRFDADLRERLIENGLATVRERFSWAAVLPLYRGLLKI
jgi:glycosyltransferase involved in cell wall biosynthesis